MILKQSLVLLIMLANAVYASAQKPFFINNKFWESGEFKTSYNTNISENEKVAGLSRFWAEVKYNFVNFDLIDNVNFDSLYLAYLPRVKATRSTNEYYKLMMSFCAKLRDGHTNVYPPRELNDQFYSRPLLRCRRIEGKVLVVGVYDTALERSGLQVGQEVMTVNNLPVKEYAAHYVTPYQSASTIQDLETRTYEYALFSGALNDPLLIQLKDENSRLRKVTLRRFNPDLVSKRFKRDAFEFRMLPGKIAYVALNSFASEEVQKEFEASFRQIKEANGLIIDVRNNGGGNSAIGWNILGFLTDRSQPVISWYTRNYKPVYRAWKRPQIIDTNFNSIEPHNGEFFNKPVALLTSSRTFSAAEDFVAAFKSMKRGSIIGMPTAGSTGQPLFIDLPGGGSARICTKRNILIDGSEFIGKGIQPDRVVIESVSDIRTGVDSALEVALAEIQKKI